MIIRVTQNPVKTIILHNTPILMPNDTFYGSRRIFGLVYLKSSKRGITVYAKSISFLKE